MRHALSLMVWLFARAKMELLAICLLLCLGAIVPLISLVP
jgi:hypothetical protein